MGARWHSSPGGSLSLAECSAAPALFLLLGPQVLLHPFPCALPRNITGNKNQRPSRPFLPGSHIRIPPWPHLPRPPPSSRRGCCLRRKYVFPTEVQPSGPTGYGDSNQDGRRWSADPPRKADGAWLGLLNCSKTQISRCFQLPYPEMAMKKECERPEPLRATQTHVNCPRLLREGRTGRPAWWPCRQAGKNHTTPH